jgi:hypothetical protein
MPWVSPTLDRVCEFLRNNSSTREQIAEGLNMSLRAVTECTQCNLKAGKRRRIYIKDWLPNGAHPAMILALGGRTANKKKPPPVSTAQRMRNLRDRRIAVVAGAKTAPNSVFAFAEAHK